MATPQEHLATLRKALADDEAMRELLSGVDALIGGIEVTLAANKIGNDNAVFLGALRDNLTSESYRRLCVVVKAALDQATTR